MAQDKSPGDLTWLVEDLVKRVAHVRHAVLLSADGLLITSTHGIGRDDAEHLSAASSSLQSLARGIGTYFKVGSPRQTIIELADAFLFVIAAGHGACLAVMSGSDADLGLVAYEMNMLVTKAEEHLAARPRLPSGQTSGG